MYAIFVLAGGVLFSDYAPPASKWYLPSVHYKCLAHFSRIAYVIKRTTHEGWWTRREPKPGQTKHKACPVGLPECLTAYTLNPTLVISSRYYLGYSNVDQRRSKEDCNCLESKISQKFDNWKIRTISITSKIVFIKSNLTGNPQCVMNCFKFPRYMHNDIGKIIGTSFRMITKNMFLSLFLL